MSDPHTAFDALAYEGSADPLQEKAFRALLACPQCHTSLEWGPLEGHCPACQETYPLHGDIPLLLHKAAGHSFAEAVADHYDHIAEGYDSVIPPHVAGHYLTKRVEFVLRHQSSGLALDVGCGTGRLAQALHRVGFSVVGLDASLGMLERMPAAPGCRRVAGFTHALPFSDRSFDLVITVATLHHVAQPQLVAATLSELWRVARPGGVVIVWDHNPANPYWPFLMRRVPQDSGAERLIPLAEVLAAFKQAVSLSTYRLGFVPDFVPAALLPFLQRLERLGEGLPVLRNLAAHNVVVVRKG